MAEEPVLLALSRENVIKWHQSCGGHARNGVAPHAVRLLHEVVEFVIECGATPQQVGAAVAEELAKAAHRDWPLPKGNPIARFLSEGQRASRLENVMLELSDVRILSILAMHYAGITEDAQTVIDYRKFRQVQTREFHADENGVLWRKRD